MRYGLLGEHLSHSFSKVIHESICDYKYELVEVAKDDLDSFMKDKEFSAINVTIPYKQDVIKYLDYVDERALAINAVNTIVNDNGYLSGYNTDFDGVISLLEKNKVSVQGKNVLILGTGGTSNTVKAVMEYLQAGRVEKVSRSGKNGALTYQEALERKDTNIIFNTTPNGMYPNNYSCPIDIDGFDKLEAVFDAIYNPLNSELVVKAKEKGLVSDGGLYMLVSQAVYAANKFVGHKIDSKEIDDVYYKLLNEKKNIVLIGMPGCGKTTIGQMLSDITNRKLIDLDVELEKYTGRTIPDIFRNDGEPQFRKLEMEVCKMFSSQTGVIISTGGGVILHKENIDALRQNGVIFYLQRDVEKLQLIDGRPLSRTIEDNKKRFSERKHLYESSCDYMVDNNGNIYDAIKEILK